MRPVAARLRRTSLTALPGTASVGKVRLPDLPETGRPESYRRTQNQQYHRANSAGTPYGQTPHHSRNRCRTARRCHSHRMCIDEYGVHRIYGQDRCGTPARQRREDEDAGCNRSARDQRKHDLKGCHQRSHTRLVLPPRRHLLHHRLHRRSAPLPRYGGTPAICYQRGNQKTAHGKRRTRVSGLSHSLHRRWKQCCRNHLPLCGRPPGTDCPCRSRRQRDRNRNDCRYHCLRQIGHYPWSTHLRYPKRGWAD